MFNLSLVQWIWIIIGGFLVGFSKTGISAFLMPVIPIIAEVFGGKASTGIILPMLIAGDAFALYYYKRNADWDKIKKLVTWTLIGLIAGLLVGQYINDKQFKIFIALSVLACLVILIYTDRKGENLKVPNSTWFHALTGVLSGFTSMIGNAAGPIFSVYLLAMGFKKDGFLGTTAWFFFLVNVTKVPMQIFVWHNITLKTVLLDLALIPAIAAGAVLGALVIRKLNEKNFKTLILIMTAIAAVRLLI
ncbi:sulfite exporter TauE/SafE family protein [Clostridium sp. SYSU_GA19001]|uniref:sulfite exporter TauE/SafE family protein n=1 Tax=Clostridium caldaquaticum TaxID=2940653 RepID=UPI0020772B09|nr:sulfite exporter TauE/SafE family protein [Clostridium caldaquaticum]MCM8711193.1 sulfite exporter TauE/SafE family protein [Clostridium caldaquaticum]